MVRATCELLSRADFVPEPRLRRFTALTAEWDPGMIVTGWHLTIEDIDERERESVIRVLVHADLRAPGWSTIGMAPFYRETYRIVGGKVHYVGIDPTCGDGPAMVGSG